MHPSAASCCLCCSLVSAQAVCAFPSLTDLSLWESECVIQTEGQQAVRAVTLPIPASSLSWTPNILLASLCCCWWEKEAAPDSACVGAG